MTLATADIGSDKGLNIWYFLSDLLLKPVDQGPFSPLHVFVALLVASLLIFVLAQIYRLTYRGTSYTQGFVISMFFMGVTTAVIMIIIGSNIARAFSLVGALSIIRFRTAVKDPRDIAFLFVSMATGMACGTGFYPAGVILTLFISSLMLIFHFTDYGAQRQVDNIVRVTYDGTEQTLAAVHGLLERHFRSYQLINRILDFAGGGAVTVYTVRPKSAAEVSAFETELRSLSGVKELVLYQSDQHAPLS